VNRMLAVIAINGWNQLASSFRTVPGAYQLRMAVSAKSGREASVSSERVSDLAIQGPLHSGVLRRGGLGDWRHLAHMWRGRKRPRSLLNLRRASWPPNTIRRQTVREGGLS
jgi:hypothetical protein